MSPAFTRRGLVSAAGATLGAVALSAGALTGAAAGSPPTAAAGATASDAALLDLLSRRVGLLAAATAAGVELDAAEQITSAAWDAKPDALWRSPADLRLCLNPSSIPSERGSLRSFYTVEDVAEMVADLEARAGRKVTLRQVERDARCREIIAAHTDWQARVDEAQACTGYDALSGRYDEAWNALVAIEREVLATPARTIAGLCAKAALAVERADRRCVDHVPVDLARELAAFRAAA